MLCEERSAAYRKQNGDKLTTRQLRRIRQKMNRAFKLAGSNIRVRAWN
jgi:hypothetical protein